MKNLIKIAVAAIILIATCIVIAIVSSTPTESSTLMDTVVQEGPAIFIGRIFMIMLLSACSLATLIPSRD